MAKSGNDFEPQQISLAGGLGDGIAGDASGDGHVGAVIVALAASCEVRRGIVAVVWQC